MFRIPHFWLTSPFPRGAQLEREQLMQQAEETKLEARTPASYPTDTAKWFHDTKIEEDFRIHHDSVPTLWLSIPSRSRGSGWSCRRSCARNLNVNGIAQRNQDGNGLNTKIGCPVPFGSWMLHLVRAEIFFFVTELLDFLNLQSRQIWTVYIYTVDYPILSPYTRQFPVSSPNGQPKTWCFWT